MNDLGRGKETLRVVLPAYNEGEALPILLGRIDRQCAISGLEYCVIVVDDGSSDNTASVVEEAAKNFPITLIRHEKNQGLAGALRTGLTAAVKESAANDLILTMDSDDTHPPGLIPRMIQLIHEGHDVAIASRFQSKSRVVGLSMFRGLLSIAARIVFTIGFPMRGVRDYTCGYRIYRATVLEEAFQEYGNRLISESGFSCMVDLLLKLRRMDYIMGEVPMILRYDQKPGVSKMAVMKTVFQTLRLILRRRLGAMD